MPIAGRVRGRPLVRTEAVWRSRRCCLPGASRSSDPQVLGEGLLEFLVGRLALRQAAEKQPELPAGQPGRMVLDEFLHAALDAAGVDRSAERHDVIIAGRRRRGFFEVQQVGLPPQLLLEFQGAGFRAAVLRFEGDEDFHVASPVRFSTEGYFSTNGRDRSYHGERQILRGAANTTGSSKYVTSSLLLPEY